MKQALLVFLLAALLTACVAPVASRPPSPTASPAQIEERLTKILRDETSGAIGFYLKPAGGPVLASFHADQEFEPASTIKVLLLYHVLRQAQTGSVNLDLPIRVYAKPATGSCPGAATTNTEPLRDALRLMMRDSDNERTKAISDTFGIDSINAQAQAIGMTHTRVNHTIGCGDQARLNHNTMTLQDAARLIEGVASASLLDAASRATFFSMMSGKQEYLETGSDPQGIWEPNLRLLVEAETPADLAPGAREDFVKQMDLAYKDGRYIFCFDGLCMEYRSVVGWAQIPFCADAGVGRRQYVFGLFIDGGIDPPSVDVAFDRTKAELFREQIRSALSNWENCGRS
ncbi:MAG: serine hydrolase [Chloroflexota bacterium]|nr:serine hydrolase [Chloroflexota bacterium]